MMGANQSNHSRDERLRIEQALATFFSYADLRCSAAGTIPPAVSEAFDIIVGYYTIRLKNVVKVFPSDSLARICDSQDLHFHAWSTLWLRGHEIKNRTPAGVCAWLKTVVRNYKLDMRIKLERLELNVRWPNDDDSGPRLDRTRTEMENCDLIPKLCWPDEVYFRYRLLCKLIREALTKLNAGEEEILRLAWKRHSLAEISRMMQFPSLNAASSFKKRALEKLAKRLYLLFLREYDRPAADLHEQEIIEEWKERFYKQGENKRCVVRIR
jgi:hypothetical protein